MDDSVASERGTDEDVATIIAFLTTARQELGLSQKDVADLIGTGQSWVSELESGAILNPRADSLARMARALGVRLSLRLQAAPWGGDDERWQRQVQLVEIAGALRERGIMVPLWGTTG